MGRDPTINKAGAELPRRVTTFVDTNVLIRHLTGDPPAMARRATAFLASASDLIVPDLILAEVVYVLESFYEVPRQEVGELARSILAFRPIRTPEPKVLLRAVELYEEHRLDFADAYLAATAEETDEGTVASFDRSLDRVTGLRRIEP